MHFKLFARSESSRMMDRKNNIPIPSLDAKDGSLGTPFPGEEYLVLYEEISRDCTTCLEIHTLNVLLVARLVDQSRPIAPLLCLLNSILRPPPWNIPETRLKRPTIFAALSPEQDMAS